MTSRLVAMTAAAFLFAMPASGVAQSQTSVTFAMPLNLTNLSVDIAKVRVECHISSSALVAIQPLAVNVGLASGATQVMVSTHVDYPVSGGQLVMLNPGATVAFAGIYVNNPTGQTATYVCNLTGFSTRLQTWDLFSATATTSAYRLSPTPVQLTGTFTW